MDLCSYLNDLPYDFEIEKVIKTLKSLRIKRVLIQVPPGLKKYSMEVARCLESLGVETYIHIDNVYGGCDLLYDDILRLLNVDLVIHYAHTPYFKDPFISPGGGSRPNYLFLTASSKLNIKDEVLDELVRAVREEGIKRIGIVSNVQHLKLIERVSKELNDKGIRTLVPKGAPPYFLDGQVIGCDYRVALSIKEDVDGYVIISGGSFHPLGLYLSARKPVIKLDPYENRVVNFTNEGERILKIRLYKVMKSFEARRWGIIVGLKTGQYRPGVLRRLIKELKRRELDYKVLVSFIISREVIEDIDNSWFDVFVVTSCPRIPIDDLGDYYKPVLTPGEARMALKRTLDKYLFPW